MSGDTVAPSRRWHASRIGWYHSARDRGIKHAYPVESPAGTSSLCTFAEGAGPHEALRNSDADYCERCQDYVID